MFSSLIKCTMSSKETVFLKVWPQFDIRSSFGRKIEKIASFCRIVRRDLSFIVAAHRFLQREKLFNFDKVEHSILIVGRYWWETSPVVGYFVAGRSELLLLRRFFNERTFRVASCYFHMILTISYQLYMDNLSFFGWSFNDFQIWEVFTFFGDLVQILTLFCFSLICSE